MPVGAVEPPVAGSASVAWVYASTATFFLSGGVFYLYLARVLPTGELGAVVVLGAIASLVSIGAALGLGGGFQHFLAYYQSRSEGGNLRLLLRYSYATIALLALAATGVVAGLSGPLSLFFFHSGGDRRLIEFLGLYAGLSTAATLLQSVLIGLQRYLVFSLVYIVASLATYGLPIVLLEFWPGPPTIVLGWILGAAVSVALAAIAVVRCARPALVPAVGGPPSVSVRALYRNVLLYSIPILAATLVGTAGSYVDRLVLASLADLSTVGIYNYAILVATGSLFLAGPFATILVPRISASYGRHQPEAIRAVGRTSVTLLVLVYVPFALGLAAIGPFLLRFLVGAAFAAASFPMALLLLLAALSIPYIILISIASGIRRTSILFDASALALGTNIGLSVLLVPRLGMVGAAIGNSSMYWIAFLVLYVELRGTGLVRMDTRSIVRIWTASGGLLAVMAVPSYLLQYRPEYVLPLVGLGFGVYLLLLRWTHAVPADVANALVRFLPRWARRARPVICWSAGCAGCDHAATPAGPVAPREYPRAAP